MFNEVALRYKASTKKGRHFHISIGAPFLDSEKRFRLAASFEHRGGAVQGKAMGSKGAASFAILSILPSKTTLRANQSS
jgi:hypothetical protein